MDSTGSSLAEAGAARLSVVGVRQWETQVTEWQEPVCGHFLLGRRQGESDPHLASGTGSHLSALSLAWPWLPGGWWSLGTSLAAVGAMGTGVLSVPWPGAGVAIATGARQREGGALQYLPGS